MTLIDGTPVLVCSDTVVVQSPSRESSPMMAHSLALALQNHFSSLDGLETIDEVGGPNIGKPIVPASVVNFNNEHIFVKNQVVSKFLADHSELEEKPSDIGDDIVRTTRKPGRPPKETGK